MKSSLLSRITDRTARVGVIGLGYVGIPLAQGIAEAGLPVIGFDVLPERIAQLDRRESPLAHMESAEIDALYANGFEPTLDYSRASECDALLICVPTPLDEHREPDLSYVEATMAALAPYLRADQMIALESTTWPGTTEERLRPVIEARGLSIGEDIFLVYSPEREDPGNARHSTVSIPKVVGGSTAACREVGTALYGVFIEKVVEVSDTRTAEMVKLLENIHRAVNIGLVNEMKIACERMGIDIFEVIEAAATKPFGFTPYWPGPGIGGHCIPVDPFYLTWKAREYGVHTRFIELAGEINAGMPDYVVARLVEALNAQGRALNGAKVLCLGIAYKRDVGDVRESPAIEVMERLRDWGADLRYSAPHVPRFPPMRRHRFDLRAEELTPETLRASDVVILLTDHTAFDYEMIERHSPLLLDTRGRFRASDRTVWKA
jgi:UDP-N-acetyl-D-glucosamine dehydrogenase